MTSPWLPTGAHQKLTGHVLYHIRAQRLWVKCEAIREALAGKDNERPELNA